jgi:hypothetical protein
MAGVTLVKRSGGVRAPSQPAFRIAYTPASQGEGTAEMG